MSLDPNRSSESLSQTTPYSRSTAEMQTMLRDIVGDLSDTYRYLDKSSNPDIGNMTLFKIDSNDPYADIGRTLEAQVFSRDAGYTKEFIEEFFSPYDRNSTFLLLVDEKADEPQLVGTLRTIDCSKGESETINMFKEFYPEKSLPSELSVDRDGEERVWDIFTVVVSPEYRDGTNSVWLYHALYRLSLEEGVDRWISNITPKEIRNLRQRLGIPFIDVPGVDPVSDITPNGNKAEYGFYSADIKKLGPAVANRIETLEATLDSDEASEKEKKLNLFLSQIARIAMNGSTQGSLESQDTPPEALSRLQKIKQIYSTAKEDIIRASWKGKLTLGGLLLMATYEWGPGNETITPIVGGRVLGLEKGIGGVALTAGVTGGFVASQQLAASYLARKTAAEFPTVSDRFFQSIKSKTETGDIRFRRFNDLPYSKRFLYSFNLGSSFNVLREAAVTGDADQDRLKKVGRTSAAIAGGSVAAIAGGVEVTNRHFENNEYVQAVMDWAIKNPGFWIGVMGVVIGADYIKNKKASSRKSLS